MNKEAILTQFGYFKDISQSSRKKLADVCIAKIVQKKEILFTEGEKGYALFCCINGHIQLHKTNPDGKQVVIKVIKPGEIFGEVILFEQNTYPVTAIALGKSQIFLVSKHQFLCLLEREDFRNDFIKTLMQKQRYLADQIKYLTTHDVEDRLYLFLKDNYGLKSRIVPAISKKDMAAAIGTTPETLSRLFMRLKIEGILDWQDKTLVIDRDLWDKRRLYTDV